MSGSGAVGANWFAISGKLGHRICNTDAREEVSPASAPLFILRVGPPTDTEGFKFSFGAKRTRATAQTKKPGSPTAGENRIQLVDRSVRPTRAYR